MAADSPVTFESERLVNPAPLLDAKLVKAAEAGWKNAAELVAAVPRDKAERKLAASALVKPAQTNPKLVLASAALVAPVPPLASETTGLVA